MKQANDQFQKMLTRQFHADTGRAPEDGDDIPHGGVLYVFCCRYVPTPTIHDSGPYWHSFTPEEVEHGEAITIKNQSLARKIMREADEQARTISDLGIFAYQHEGLVIIRNPKQLIAHLRKHPAS